MPSPTFTLAQEPDLTTLIGACGDEPGWLCGLVWELSQGDGELARRACSARQAAMAP